MSDRRKIGIALVAVGLVTFIIYLPALGNGFVEWDDREYVLENLNIRVLHIQSLQWMFLDYHSANWHPLTWLSLSIDYLIWGLNPKGYHFTNIILHTINSMLVVIMARMLFVSAKGTQHLALHFAVLVGLFFGLHPIHVESVAWVSERKDLLYCLFYLLSIIFYLEYRVKNSKLNYLLCLLTFLLSALSKPMAISLPLVLVVLDFYPLRIIRPDWASIFKSVWDKFPLFIAAIVLATITFSKGDLVRFSGEAMMNDFYSKTLDRTFPAILFVGDVQSVAPGSETLSETLAAAPDVTNLHNNMAAKSTAEAGPVVVEPLEGGKTIAEIITEHEQFEGQEVSLRAKVTKFSPNILGKNWITLQDGTRTETDNKLVVTSSETIAVGDEVVVKGLVRVNVDIGAGYTYKVLLEEGSFSL